MYVNFKPMLEVQTEGCNLKAMFVDLLCTWFATEGAPFYRRVPKNTECFCSIVLYDHIKTVI